jgi:hypothetical protein
MINRPKNNPQICGETQIDVVRKKEEYSLNGRLLAQAKNLDISVLNNPNKVGEKKYWIIPRMLAARI